MDKYLCHRLNYSFYSNLQMQKNVLEMKTQSVTKQEKMKLRQRHTHS